ncbi:MAG: hypothetical protein JOZ54_04760 [Acidobacteria bacterium]|nr:hypothetical protein [Acidobacteriota bacterium]
MHIASTLLLAALSVRAPDAARSAMPLPAFSDAAAESSPFDPAQSTALFVGVRTFAEESELAEVRYAVDDAIDLAYALAIDRSAPLVLPSRVALALSGEPQKATSRERLRELKAAGAKVYPARNEDILYRLYLTFEGKLIRVSVDDGATTSARFHLISAQ